MGKRKAVIALGGNAIQSGDASAKSQKLALEITANELISFIKNNIDVIITHGNGPQVGNVLLQQKEANSISNPAMPLDICVGMTQGMIGYWMQNAFDKALKQNGIKKDIATIITQVIVDENDTAFSSPSKPIGPFLTESEAKTLMEQKGAIFKEDAGRGFRRVVPSPKPISIYEHKIISDLVELGNIIIAVGGGGIPVIENDNELIGIEAVIDKDFAAQKLAELVDANDLIILTAVENVYLNYNQPTQRKLENISVNELENYIKAGHFAQGSMLPKVEAAISFVKSKPGRRSIITSLGQAYDAFMGRAGTIIS